MAHSKYRMSHKKSNNHGKLVYVKKSDISDINGATYCNTSI